MKDYKELTGEAERLARKLYFLSKDSKVIINGLSKRITILKEGNYKEQESIFKNNIIFDELVNKDVLVVDKKGDDFNYYTFSIDYYNYLKNKLKLSESQKAMVENYLSYKSKGLDTYISHYRFGNREHDYTYTLARREGDNLKLVNTFPFEYKKRTVNSLFNKKLLVSVTTKGRIVNDVEATHLLYDKTGEKVIGGKYLNAKGELI